MSSARARRSSAGPLIDARRLGKTFPTREGQVLEALVDVNMQISEGEFVAVVGPSGCGKTTLLNLIAGLETKSSGTLTVRGAPVEGPSRDIGIVFQEPVLLPWRTVMTNVLLPVEVLDLPRRQYAARASELLEMVGLHGFEERYPFELSGGMQQRVAITRALIHDPAILLMDEPFGALDAMTREGMNVELLRIWQNSGKTVFFITHSISESVFLADRVVVLSPRPGRIAEIVAVPLPRPRSLDMLGLPEFGETSTHIRHLLNAAGDID